jgi:hypothetical protein
MRSVVLIVFWILAPSGMWRRLIWYRCTYQYLWETSCRRVQYARVSLYTTDIVYFKIYIHFNFLPQYNKNLNRCSNRVGCSRTHLTVRLLWGRWEITWRTIRRVMEEIFPGAKQKEHEVGGLISFQDRGSNCLHGGHKDTLTYTSQQNRENGSRNG